MQAIKEIPEISVGFEIVPGRLVTSRHMRDARKKEHLDMTTGKPGLPVSERTLQVFGHQQ